ncbi:MAG: bifunctional metallophosphatase/5'-nucleotidase, partial [Longimicrobiales bacterium]
RARRDRARRRGARLDPGAVRRTGVSTPVRGGGRGTRLLALVLLLGAAGCAPTARPTAAAPAPAADHPAAGRVRLALLGTTDLHGWILPHDYYTGRATPWGLARLAPLIDSVRAAHPGRTYLFESGDILQGSPLAFVHARLETEAPNPIVGALERARYDAAAIGNHEFNYGLDYLRSVIAASDFPWLSANIFVAGTTDHAFAAYTLLPHVIAAGDTLLIGVTANTPPGVALWDRHHVEGVLEFRDVVHSVGDVVDEMRARGADLVVVLSHGGFGGTSYDTLATGLPPENAVGELARVVPAIDVIFMGHTHEAVQDTTLNGVLITQPDNWAGSLAAVDVELARAAPGEYRVAWKRARLIRPDSTRADSAFLAAFRPAHERTLDWVRSVVGRATEPMSARTARVEDTAILDFINEVQRATAGTQLSSTAAFNTRARIPAGPVTIADIAALYIYDNTLKAVRITGAQLRAYLEKSTEYYQGWSETRGPIVDPDVPGYNFDVVYGVDYTVDLRRPIGQRITRLEFEGRPVEPDDTFTLALNNYRQNGGGGFTMLSDAPVIYDRQEDIRALLIEEVRRRGVLRPADYFRRNWELVPAADGSRPRPRSPLPSR